MNNRVIVSIVGLGIFVGGFSQLASLPVTVICAVGLGIMLGSVFSAINSSRK